MHTVHRNPGGVVTDDQYRYQIGSYNIDIYDVSDRLLLKEYLFLSQCIFILRTHDFIWVSSVT